MGRRAPMRRYTARRSDARLSMGTGTPGAGRGEGGRSLRNLPWSKVLGALLLAASRGILASWTVGLRFRVTQVTMEAIGEAPLRVVGQVDVERIVPLLGTNLLLLNRAQVAQELAGALGCIEQVEVRTQLPGRVELRLKEYDRVMVWESGGESWWVEPHGRVLGKATIPADLVVIHDKGGRTADMGSLIPEVPWWLARDMAQVLPAIRSFDYAPREGLMVYVTAEQWPVYLGDRGNARAKGAALESLVGELVARGLGVEYIDLRFEERPSFRPRS